MESPHRAYVEVKLHPLYTSLELIMYVLDVCKGCVYKEIRGMISGPPRSPGENAGRTSAGIRPLTQKGIPWDLIVWDLYRI